MDDPHVRHMDARRHLEVLANAPAGPKITTSAQWLGCAYVLYVMNHKGKNIRLNGFYKRQ